MQRLASSRYGKRERRNSFLGDGLRLRSSRRGLEWLWWTWRGSCVNFALIDIASAVVVVVWQQENVEEDATSEMEGRPQEQAPSPSEPAARGGGSLLAAMWSEAEPEGGARGGAAEPEPPPEGDALAHEPAGAGAVAAPEPVADAPPDCCYRVQPPAALGCCPSLPLLDAVSAAGSAAAAPEPMMMLDSGSSMLCTVVVGNAFLIALAFFLHPRNRRKVHKLLQASLRPESSKRGASKVSVLPAGSQTTVTYPLHVRCRNGITAPRRSPRRSSRR